MMNRLVRIFVVLVAVAASAEACTVPVFRYALDRWQPDGFGVVAGEKWRAADAGRKLAAVMEERVANVLWQDEGEGEAGKIGLMWPRSEVALWSGGADPVAVEAMISSPARKELAKRIFAGQSAVWVVVGSKDQAADDAFAKRLKKRLKYLESVAAIPEQDPHDPESRLGPGPELKVGFSMIRVKHGDPKERFFLPMLAGPEGEELMAGKEPFAGVVFGRGRVLGAWKASDLEDEGVDEISLFLLGACSCRVKFMNPGWDLLMNTDWDSGLMEVQMKRDQKAEEKGEEGKEAPEDE